MSVTHPEDRKPIPAAVIREEPFTPVFARKASSRNKPVKTWMILGPIGLLVLGGATAAILMNPVEESAPLAEPAPSFILPAPVETPAPATLEAEPLVVEAAPIAEIAPAPVRTQRQAAPASRRTPPAAPQAAPRVEPAPAPAGPQPYTGSLNTGASTPTPAPTPAAPASPPVIVFTPVG